MTNIKIAGIEIYKGKNIVDNEYYIQYFKKQGKDVKDLYENIMGRRERVEIDREKENALTMAIESSIKVLKSCDLTGEDIDMIVYSGMLGEYVSPTSAIFIHNAIRGKKECFCHDMNVNCIGMTYGLDLISRYMVSNENVKRVLLVGSENLTPQVSAENEELYGTFGDVSCAIILEKTDGDSGLLDTRVGVNTNPYVGYVRFLACGSSKIYSKPKNEIYTKWNSFGKWWIDEAINNIDEMLAKNCLSRSDISMYCFSQISVKNIEILREKMNIPEKKSLYVAYFYGYTGTTSPFLAFYEGIKRKLIKRGDYIIFCTVAAGSTHIEVMIKY